MHAIEHIPLSNLVASKLNVRKHGTKDVDTLAASIEHIGLLQPLVVRRTPDGGHEVLAGGRRHRALNKLNDDKTIEIPCVVITEGDDPLAIEASLAENIERSDMDEFDQYNAIAALIKAGQSEQQAADAFGVPLSTIHKRLALSRLAPGVQALYRSGSIDAEALKFLTLAPKARQLDYIKLHKDKQQPPNWQLRSWLLGGAAINTSVAIFPFELYTGPITTDLFQDERLFGDAEQFWMLQNQAIAAKRDAFLAAGWAVVTILDPSTRFSDWDYVPVTKAAGGHVIIEVEADGTVTEHKGKLPKRLARNQTRQQTGAARQSGDPTTAGDVGEETETAEDRALDRPELTEPLANFIDTVRLMAVRADILKHPKIALRLLLAHLAGGALYLKANEANLPNIPDGVSEALAELETHKKMLAATDAARELLGRAPNEAVIRDSGSFTSPNRTAEIFATLLAATDAQVMTFAAYLMAQTLAINTDIVDDVGAHFGTDVRKHWDPSDHLLDLVRDKETSSLILEEVIGAKAAASFAAATGRAKRDVIAKALTGNGREKIADWQPKWTRFPAGAYTVRRRTSRGSGKA